MNQEEVNAFNEKYSDAKCHVCEQHVDGDTVWYCGNECETWYCEDCIEERNDKGEDHCCEDCSNYEECEWCGDCHHYEDKCR